MVRSKYLIPILFLVNSFVYAQEVFEEPKTIFQLFTESNEKSRQAELEGLQAQISQKQEDVEKARRAYEEARRKEQELKNAFQETNNRLASESKQFTQLDKRTRELYGELDRKEQALEQFRGKVKQELGIDLKLEDDKWFDGWQVRISSLESEKSEGMPIDEAELARLKRQQAELNKYKAMQDEIDDFVDDHDLDDDKLNALRTDVQKYKNRAEDQFFAWEKQRQLVYEGENSLEARHQETLAALVSKKKDLEAYQSDESAKRRIAMMNADALVSKQKERMFDARFLLSDLDHVKTRDRLSDLEVEALKTKMKDALDNTLLGAYVEAEIAQALKENEKSRNPSMAVQQLDVYRYFQQLIKTDEMCRAVMQCAPFRPTSSNAPGQVDDSARMGEGSGMIPGMSAPLLDNARSR